MNKPAVPTLKFKQTGRDRTSGTSRFTTTLREIGLTGLTKAEADEIQLRLMKHAMCILEKAYARGLFYFDGKKAVFSGGKVVCA